MSNFSDILEYKPELDVLMIVGEVEDKYVLRWPQDRHELILPLCTLLGTTDFIIGVGVSGGFHLAVIQFDEPMYWKVNTLINKIGEFIQWSKLTRQYR